jgi:DNA-binding SARP family transcriptional activator/Flp pilus assembly protein TadD
MLALRVLGGFEVVLEGHEVTELTAQPSRAALLVLLGMEGSTTRDAVVGVLWPDHDPQKARHALSQTLHRLRGSLGEGWLETEGERLAVSAEVEVDARSFEDLVDAKEYERAVALYRGGFLHGWFLADSSVFERWADQQRARFERLHRLARREAIRIRRERGDVAAALLLAQEWAEIDPLEDEAQHRLIELMAESGRRSDALAQYDLYARLLREEDLTPLDETVQLVARLRQAADLGPLEDVGDDAEPPPAPAEVPARAPPPALTAAAAVVRPADNPGELEHTTALRRPFPSFSALPALPGGGSARGWRARIPGWARPAGIAVAAAATFVAAVLLGREMAPGAPDLSAALPPGSRLVLAEFGNDTRDSLVAGVVTEALRIDLERYLHSSLADPAEVARVLSRMRRSPLTPLSGDTAREVALRAGIPAVIDGKVGAVGAGFVLSAWIVSAEDGRVIDAALATAHDSTELIDAIGSLSLQLREKIQPSVAVLSPPARLAQVTTSSLEALRKYTTAMRVWRDEGSGARSLHLLDEATTLDSTFAMAYRARATILMNVGASRGTWIDALTKAYRHRDHLSEPERYLTLATYYQSAMGNLEEATRAYEELLALDSTNLTALNNLGTVYRDRHDYAGAEAVLRRCVAGDSLVLTCRLNLGSVVHALGRPDEARAIAEGTVRRFPGNPYAAAQLGHIAAAEQDYAGADTLYANLSRFDLPAPGVLEVWLAWVDGVRGRVEEARHHLSNARRITLGTDPRTLTTALFAEAWLDLGITGDTARAIQEMEAALRDPVLAGRAPVDMPYLEVADFFLDAGRPDRGAALLETYLSEVPPEWRAPEDLWIYIIRGRLAMEEGRFEEAREAFDVAATLPGSPMFVLQYLGPLYDRAGRPDSAIVGYERYLASSNLDRFAFDSVILPGVLERLGELHEAAGHASQAADYYARFADLWSGADPELQPRVEAARRKAEALSRDRGGATASRP